MTDERLRALERRFRETGAFDVEVEWLRGRLRARELARERALLAARCGHAAAVAAVDGSTERPPMLSEHAAQWLAAERVDRHSDVPPDPGGELVVDTRLALAVVHATAASAGQREALARLEAWVLAGALPAQAPPGRPIPILSPDHGPADLLTAALGYPRRYDDPGPARTGQKEYDSYRARWTAALEVAESMRADEDLRGAARRELVPWALGYGDPVRERAAERGEVEILPGDLEAQGSRWASQRRAADSERQSSLRRPGAGR